MRNVFVFVVLIVLAQNSVAQTPVSGTVRDIASKPVAGATVALKDSYDGTTTDSLGRFSFNTIEKRTKVVTVSSMGYKTAEQKINLNGPVRDLVFVIKEEINKMKAVIITAGYVEAS